MVFSSFTQISTFISLPLPPPKNNLDFQVGVGKVLKRKRILTQEEILQLRNKSDSELSDLSDDEYAVNKTYESRILEEESSSNESDEEKHRNICNGKTILDHFLPSMSLERIHYIDLAVANSSFLCKHNAISNKIPLKIKTDRLKFKLEIVKALSASSLTNKSILRMKITV
ncbi:hypothetical protein TNCV_2080921 [Trichonephila clavipes]|nr:hypothetical protein TNCV_2080921 [Trichonephila clavipes]